MARQRIQFKLLLTFAAQFVLNFTFVNGIVPLIMSPNEASHAALMRDLEKCGILLTETNMIRNAWLDITGSKGIAAPKIQVAINAMKKVQQELSSRGIQLDVNQEQVDKLIADLKTKTNFKLSDLDRAILKWAEFLGIYTIPAKLENWKMMGQRQYNVFLAKFKQLENCHKLSSDNKFPMTFIIAEGNNGGIGIQTVLKFLEAKKPVRLTVVIVSRYKIEKDGDDETEWNNSLNDLKKHEGDYLKVIDTRIIRQIKKTPNDFEKMRAQFDDEIAGVKGALGQIDLKSCNVIFEAIVPAGFQEATVDNGKFLLRTGVAETAIQWMNDSQKKYPQIQLVSIEARCHTSNDHGHYNVTKNGSEIAVQKLPHYNANMFLLGVLPREYLLAHEKDKTNQRVYQLRNTETYFILQADSKGNNISNAKFIKEAIVASRGAWPSEYDEFLNALTSAESTGLEYVEITMPNRMETGKPFLAEDIGAIDKTNDRILLPLNEL